MVEYLYVYAHAVWYMVHAPTLLCLLEHLSLATCSSVLHSILVHNPCLTCCLILGVRTQHGAVDYVYSLSFFLHLARSPCNGRCFIYAPSPPLDVDLNELLQVIHAQVRASTQHDEQLKAPLETYLSGQPPVPVVSPAPTPHIPASLSPSIDRPCCRRPRWQISQHGVRPGTITLIASYLQLSLCPLVCLPFDRCWTKTSATSFVKASFLYHKIQRTLFCVLQLKVSRRVRSSGM